MSVLTPYQRSLLERAQQAIGGFLWLGNNLHNIKGSPDAFRQFYEIALGDAQPVYDAIKGLLATPATDNATGKDEEG